MADWTKICELEALTIDEPFGARLGETPIVLIRKPEGVYVIHGLCTHARVMLSKGGFVEDYAIECPLHEGRFDIRSGRCLGGPPKEDIRTFPAKIEDGQVWVTAPDSP